MVGMYWWKGLEDWTFGLFAFISGYAVVIFMWAYMLYPAEFPAGVDFEAFFFDNRRWFFGIQVLTVLWDAPEVLQKAALHLRPVPAQYGYLITGLLVVSLVGLITDKRRVHAVLCIAWLLLFLGYEFLTSVTRIVLQLT
jgi:hypothetical protein